MAGLLGCGGECSVGSEGEGEWKKGVQPQSTRLKLGKQLEIEGDVLGWTSSYSEGGMTTTSERVQ